MGQKTGSKPPSLSANFVKALLNPVIDPSGVTVTFVTVAMKLMPTTHLTRFLCCSLALVVLLSSTGFGTVEHWCKMRGHTKSLLVASDGCRKSCQADQTPEPASGEHALKGMPCCKTTLSYEHLDVSRFVTDQHPVAVPQPAEFIPNPEFRLLLAAILPADRLSAVPSLADDPLPRTGRFRLISLCTWLI